MTTATAEIYPQKTRLIQTLSIDSPGTATKNKMHRSKDSSILGPTSRGTDPRSCVNLDHLSQHTDPDNMPREPDNLQLHNLCNDKSLVTNELLEKLGLGLRHGVAIKQKDVNPIDFMQLRISVRLQFTEFDRKDDKPISIQHYT